VDQAGKFARTDYYIEWERKATAFARRGPHLLLFSPGYIEVRSIDTGRLLRMVEANELRLLRSGLAGGLLLVGVVKGGSEADGSRTEKLVQVLYNGND
jgi:RHO1 GDP-GTP exchange protein 1/2